MNDLTIYHKYRSKMRPGDVISYKGEGFISWLILRIDKRSHVSGVVSGPINPMVADMKMIAEADEGEVNIRRLSEKLLYYQGKAWWHQLKPEFDMFRARISAFYWNCVGIHYDYKGIIGQIPAILTGNPNFGRVNSEGSKYWCSEVCGMSLLGTDDYPVIPRELLRGLLPHPDLERLLAGGGLRPGEIARLPVFLPEVQII
uniref:Peptidase n=1 Tax=viral metagenome TaxID=1070528 RepID=A0A6H1ZLS7_9ZZZZ